MTNVRAHRIGHAPIIQRFADQRMGANVNGPSLIKTPDWLAGRFGTYHLYFAHHLGSYIRLAYADHLEGPWRIHSPGVLDIAEVPFLYEHIASPDVHVDENTKEIRMYFHGVSDPQPWEAPTQSSCVATSKDGLAFRPQDTILGAPYFRVWQQSGFHYAIGLGGSLWRSKDGLTAFEEGPTLSGLPKHTRHPAVLQQGDKIWVAWTAIGDCPERILIAEVDTSGDWNEWLIENPQELLKPERDYEGSELPLVASRADIAPAPAHQLRDPAFYVEEDRVYMVYAVAGEAGLAIAELQFEG
ncbi:MAG: hypothetical protein P8L68_02925 [Paracoccaceae bacterium]|nr:hypothetical protein [Paracoccaceae bacterium]